MNTIVSVPSEVIMSKIFFIRGKKVMLDKDLAEIYGVLTKDLKRAVKRNQARFPLDFMFELSKVEFENLRCQFVTSSWGGHRYSPYAFTEQGVAMLSSVLHSEKAVQMNIQIIRTFTKLREILTDNKKLAEKLEFIERKYDKHIYQIITAINELKDDKKKRDEDEGPKEPIGFRIPRKK